MAILKISEFSNCYVLDLTEKGRPGAARGEFENYENYENYDSYVFSICNLIILIMLIAICKWLRPNSAKESKRLRNCREPPGTFGVSSISTPVAIFSIAQLMVSSP